VKVAIDAVSGRPAMTGEPREGSRPSATLHFVFSEPRRMALEICKARLAGQMRVSTLGSVGRPYGQRHCPVHRV